MTPLCLTIIVALCSLAALAAASLCLTPSPRLGKSPDMLLRKLAASEDIMG
ncbi:hypothetical protein [Azospirillum picis]|uniref:Uncharacterized protein n=1 Tax=Azospirillum picis TaxID=488438 RepID=A0ABU0MT94_9PROT|nr:hypothetical protein [Azospirillum picis]MBP2302943.1 hypothetical protein [Azospirillum picis]MDQ0536695.1 hypothetical protein [Azospirillum picis]